MTIATHDHVSFGGTGRDSLAAASLVALRPVFDLGRPRDFRIALWDGSELSPETGSEARFTLRFHGPAALRRFLTASGQVGLAEGYIYGDYDIEGSVDATIEAGRALLERPLALADRARVARLLMILPRERRDVVRPGQAVRRQGMRHSKARDRRAVSYHYDVSNDFYGLWLDEQMVYSCGYFEQGDEDIHQAQRQKLEHTCRKLRLRPGERLLDIGCGWGALMLHAARHYGVDVTGVTLSHHQAEEARRRIAAAGLSDRCHVHLMDYRDLPATPGFDKIVSIGMFEHVGRAQFSTYFRKAWSLLKPGGVFLNHAISEPYPYNRDTSPTLINSYVFPDAELVPLFEAQEMAERIGFEVRDVENLREHYARTLAHWASRLEANQVAAVAASNPVVYRIWRLYMHGSGQAFRENRIQIFQSLYSKSDAVGRSHLPLTRRDWYARSTAES